MDTSTAATQASVTLATIRTWCRKGAVAAAKVAGRWIIEAASLARRIALGNQTPDLTREFCDVVGDSAYDAADDYNVTALTSLLNLVKARDIAAIMGRACRVSLTEDGWYRLERLVSFQRGCVIAER